MLSFCSFMGYGSIFMKKMCKLKITANLLLLFFCLPFFFSSCSKELKKDSFTNALNQIDSLINQNQYKDAEILLDKITADAYSSWAKIGIFRRFCLIEKKTKAEKIIAEGLKKNPENLEMLAVYSNFLLDDDRLDLALHFSEKLQNTKYGSIYSEAVIRNTIEKSNKNDLNHIFKEEKYFQVYYDAYTGTQNTAWLKNAALLYLAKGAYNSAANIAPVELFKIDDAYFWALVMFDAARYGDCINYSNAAEQMLRENFSLQNKKHVAESEIIAIESDAYTLLSDSENAEKVRRKYLDSIKGDINSSEKWKLSEIEKKSAFVPIIFSNSAKWAYDNQDDFRAADLLTFCVDTWPDYVQGLISYAQFAYNSSKNRDEDFVQRQLRDKGLATLEMEQYDNRARIPVSDALYRIKKSLERTNNPALYVLNIDLSQRISPSTNKIQQAALIWKLLEENAEQKSVYPDIILDYALNFFLQEKMHDEAFRAFSNHVSSKYLISLGDDFWTSIVKEIKSFSQIEVEYSAFFAAYFKLSDTALRLYEYAVYEFGTEPNDKVISPLTTNTSCVNLAMILNSLGYKKESLELYGKIAGRCTERTIKSLVMYRMALIQFGYNDLRSAKRSCEYAVSLDNENIDAKNLLFKMQTMVK